MCLGLAQYWRRRFDFASDIGCDLSDFVDVYVWASGEVFCAEAPDGFFTVLGLRVAGALFVLLALLVGLWRGRRAAKAGDPWPVRRVNLRLAAAVDRRLPGFHPELPRQPTWPWNLLLVLMIGLAGWGGTWAWDRYQQHQLEEQLARSQAALALLQLPTSITRSEEDQWCTSTVDTICATSELTVAQLERELLHLLAPAQTTHRGHCPGSQTVCTLSVMGRYRGEPLAASANFHNARTETGGLPPGARRLGQSPFYYLHTDVMFYPGPP
jgi:hypothetical protein